MRGANLTSELNKFLCRKGDTLHITDHTFTILCDEGSDPKPGESTHPEVNRTQLCSILLESIPRDTIKWGHKVKQAIQAVDDTYTLLSKNQPEVTGFDIVIGCDGAWSKIHSLVSETVPHYSGISTIKVHHCDVSTWNPTLSSIVGLGTLFCLHDSKVLCGQRNGDDSIHVYAMLPTEKSWVSTCGINWKNMMKATEELKDWHYSSWDEKLQDFITKADGDTLVLRTMYVLPIKFSWPQHNGITVISDAAHLISPFAGEGVNLAMWDAMLLRQSLVGVLKDGSTDKDKVWKATGAFEEEIFMRASEKAEEACKHMEMFVQPDAAEKVVTMFETMMAQGSPPESR